MTDLVSSKLDAIHQDVASTVLKDFMGTYELRRQDSVLDDDFQLWRADTIWRLMNNMGEYGE